jgi:transposase
MAIKNYLTLEEKQELQQQLKFHEHPDIRERILILLLRNDGRTQQEIADFLGCCLRKVAYWCAHGDPNNLDSLTDERMKGNFHKVTEKYVELLLEVIEKAPQAYGYAFGNWTAKRLATHLEQETGITLSGSQVRRILVKKNTFISGQNTVLKRSSIPKKESCSRQSWRNIYALRKKVQTASKSGSGTSLDLI